MNVTALGLATASLVATLAWSATPSAAQQLAPGTRVRVTVADGRIVGNVEASSPDSLALAPGAAGTPLTFRWAEVSRIEQSLGRRGHAGRGALIGAGTMTILTLLSIGGGSEGEDWGDTLVLLALPVNAAFGAGIGALVGLVWRTERWAPLPLTTTQQR